MAAEHLIMNLSKLRKAQYKSRYYLLEELLDGRHELLQRLALVGGERVGVGEHLRRLEAPAEQVQRERAALARRGPRLRLRRCTAHATPLQIIVVWYK